MKPTLSEGQDMLRILKGSFAEVLSHGLGSSYCLDLGDGDGYGGGYYGSERAGLTEETQGDQDE